MRTWEANTLEVAPHRPEILSSGDAARVIALNLPAGELLQEHEVHEQALLVVLEGEVEVESGGETIGGRRGLVAEFGPGERHEVRATHDARLLLVLTPWPGDGHPGAMTLDEKATARERAHERSQA
ncbi:MAG: cupin domain-containing protein [Thermoleophilaceae bacterium]